MTGREPRKLLTVEQTAERLGIAAQTIYNGIARRTLKPFPIRAKRWGRKVLFDSRDIDSFIDSMPYANTLDIESS
jgi:excisionase family DNA binding protein